MSSLTLRDKWIACGLPALVTLLAGGLFVVRPANRELANLRRRVENQGSPTARQQLIESANAEHAALQRAMVELRKTIDEDGNKFDRNWSMQQISRLCAQHGLGLNSSTVEANAKLPASLREAAKSFSKDTSPPQVWRFEIVGAYPSVVALLDDLNKAKPLIVPVGLSMEANKNERKPAVWNLSIWL